MDMQTVTVLCTRFDDYVKAVPQNSGNKKKEVQIAKCEGCGEDVIATDVGLAKVRCLHCVYC